ncbi:DUF6777 domain-containing protein [Streptomyces sp. NBC_01013]|uniref:DUF6777 domain-containing protein n=1 Tax=Streptomyces sp. NBC_01013 TaxID=2903718 RepID=UPI0038699D73|nr:hypothetical protein OG538_02295 [Streptomyces sp. NBC_01013]
MHAPTRMRRAVLAVLSTGILVTAGCARETGGGGHGTEGTSDAEEVLLQPAAEQGPDPFTRSTVEPAGAAPRTTPPRAPVPGDGGPHTLPGSTPGIYGGTRSVASCDVGQQARLLAADPARKDAFAQAAGVPRNEVADFLSGLTPLVLRADTLVADHGFREGSAHTFQAVLQAGTAVMVDGHGLPRVRCACGNPLGRPVGARGTESGRGEKWEGYDPARIVVVAPTVEPVTALVVVDADHNSWMERPVGDEGARDRTPEVPPPYAADTDITGPLPDAPSAKPREPKVPEKSVAPPPSRSAPAPGDCPTPGAPTPPGEAVAATEQPTGAPESRPSNCPTPSDGPTDDYPELPTDEPTGTPVDPDEPPQDLVPPMTDEPQTSIRLPWQDDVDAPVDG